MALPGTPGQRISDLCNGNKIKQKELAEKIGVSASQLSRIVSGETRTVSSDILIGVAKEFKVSTDYILGLSNISVRKSYDIFEIGQRLSIGVGDAGTMMLQAERDDVLRRQLVMIDISGCGLRNIVVLTVQATEVTTRTGQRQTCRARMEVVQRLFFYWVDG